MDGLGEVKTKKNGTFRRAHTSYREPGLSFQPSHENERRTRGTKALALLLVPFVVDLTETETWIEKATIRKVQ